MESFNISHAERHLRKKLRYDYEDLEMLEIVKKFKVAGFFDGNFPKWNL